VVIIGAGQAGLAMSHCLSELGIAHVVVERGAIAQRWRSHGWDSLRLLTPNWMTRLPGHRYGGDDPDGFMTTAELVTFLEVYAARSRTPVIEHTTVGHVERWQQGYRIATDRGDWCANAVVVATGYCDQPAIPALGLQLAPWVGQLAPADYHNPQQLPDGGVLIVGASATGVQLADELQRAGHPVVLAVGRHTRLPRRYRGHDILWWLDQLGALSQDAASVHDLEISRAQPSLQLVGRPDHASVDLGRLAVAGVRLAGHLVDVHRTRVTFADDLIATTAAADIKLATILQRIDDFIDCTGAVAEGPEPFVPTWPVAARALPAVDLQSEGIRTVIWATGYRRTYPWLQVPVFDAAGEIRHVGGVTSSPGLYVLGLNFQRRRNSSFIDGVGRDAQELADHIARALLQRIA
jgi:putative flavoprotein involved in K+ transport